MFQCQSWNISWENLRKNYRNDRNPTYIQSNFESTWTLSNLSSVAYLTKSGLVWDQYDRDSNRISLLSEFPDRSFFPCRKL